MKPIDVFEKMVNLDDELIEAATLPEVAATAAGAGRLRRGLARFSEYMNRPAVVAAACVLVAFGVLAGIVGAGQMAANQKSDSAVSPENNELPNHSHGNAWADTEDAADNAGGEDSNLLDGPGSAGAVDPPAEDVSEPSEELSSSREEISTAPEDESEPEILLPDVLPSVPTVDVSIWWGNEGMNLPQYVVAYSGTVMTANGAVNMEMDGPGARYQLEAIAGELVTIRYKGDMGVGLPPTCTPRDWVMYNEDYVVLDQSENFDKLPDAVALMKGPMEGRESHSVYIVLAVDYKYGDDRGLFEYAFRVQFGESEEGTWGADTTPVYPEEDSTIANEGWGEDTPETDRPLEETSVSWENDAVITPDETLKMIADGERSIYPYAHLVYVGSRDEDTGRWVSDSRPTFDRWAPESAPNYINELPVLTWEGGELKLALRFEDRMTVKHLVVYHPDLTYIDTVYDVADLKAFGWGQYLVIAEVHRQEADEEFIYQHVFILEWE